MKDTSRSQVLPHAYPVGVIGVGRVGAPLAAALQRAGHPSVAVSANSPASRLRAADLLPGVPLTDPAEVLRHASLILLTVPDDALPRLVSDLVSSQVVRPGHHLVHTSGRHGTEVLGPALRVGALPIALHPAMTFTGTDRDLPRLAACSFGVTAAPGSRPVAEEIVCALGTGHIEWIDETVRPLYHAGMAIGANHLVTLVAQSMGLLAKAGINDPGRMLGPLLTAALDNVLLTGDSALTGPVARGDTGTVRAHIDQLHEHAPQLLAPYLALARSTTQVAVASGTLSPSRARRVLAVLDEASTSIRQ
ncbi:DUF2520 domain-containing protein [Streptomyces sp. TX20-6-3]|uniref:Rossmann-like and DUF2520 domain-containing protein n=1 Tax=Streptomyces sp. TX20-6-3 TaxID=3028705 RepID=UPI0029A0E808|nr:Rossmann-like and DUF2520 domain-containing protein [Streptomyces sp. TX20-6-3]MDX2565438.1 DUF2520 domain-containing protein [Streptomyces sp. TX20-6-3]